ncbi:Protein GLUTAMINE DUMPER [Melia azedarach]|uniref:Protein GLUTAMINE DUMPER n=1 Tax=Melia azedarach TaxID=155640 RepID=A0ACC1X7L5_MELAZ|nr:Protein GLUTAMINE DUMPER [Melia azedarach]
MRHHYANNSSSTTAGAGANGGGLGHWNSPIPYLFGGLGLMLGLITIALLILACSYRKSSSNLQSEDEEKSGDKKVNMQQIEMEPKIVVIMAGEDNPRYLAKPVSCSYCQQNDHV